MRIDCCPSSETPAHLEFRRCATGAQRSTEIMINRDQRRCALGQSYWEVLLDQLVSWENPVTKHMPQVGSDLLHCEERGVWVRAGEERPD